MALSGSGALERGIRIATTPGANAGSIDLRFASGDAAAAIAQQTGVKAYREPSDMFAPVGDEHGLFIVVKRGRVWFNSQDRRAELYPAQAEIEAAGRHYTVDVADGRFTARPL